MSLLGIDRTGNNNHWTVNNMTVATDQMLDSPTNNFCTLNPLDTSPTGTISEGNLQQDSYTNTWRGIRSTHFVDSGKWYWEVELNSGTGADRGMVGVSNSSASLTTHADSNCRFYNASGGQKYSSSSSSAYGNASYNGDIVGVALDMDNGKIWWAINNVWQASGSPTSGTNEAFSGLTGEWSPDCRQYTTYNWVANFGQDSSFAGNKTAQGNQDSNSIGDFYYEPPTDFLALCTSNLPDPAVIPSEHFNTVLWTGNATQRNITGVGFQPDLVWGKNRAYVNWNEINDSVRGATKSIYSNDTLAEGIDTQKLQAFLSDGFQIGTAAGFNKTGDAHVAWNWKANGAGVSNTNGSITSTVSANADAGFSIVSYTGTGSSGTVGHGLSSKPEAWFIKGRDNADHWFSYNEALGIDSYIYLNVTSAKITGGADPWNSTEPTTSVISLKTDGGINGSGLGYIMYAFHSVEGYSKVGSYTGNGSTDGTFVHCGFRPAYVMIKRTDAASDWRLWDAERATYNQANAHLLPNSSAVENTSIGLDLTSNGFKLRSADTEYNASGGTYIFLAFAEHPFKYTNAR